MRGPVRPPRLSSFVSPSPFHIAFFALSPFPPLARCHFLCLQSLHPCLSALLLEPRGSNPSLPLPIPLPQAGWERWREDDGEGCVGGRSAGKDGRQLTTPCHEKTMKRPSERDTRKQRLSLTTAVARMALSMWMLALRKMSTLQSLWLLPSWLIKPGKSSSWLLRIP